MALVTYAIDMAAQAARIFGAVLLGTACIAAFALVAMTERARPDANWAPVVLVVVGLYVVPAALMFFLAGRIARGARWATIAAMILPIVAVFGIGARSIASSPGEGAAGIVALACVGIPLVVPALYLIARCLNALPDFRFLQTPAPRARGFEVGPPVGAPPGNANARPTFVPPPPAGGSIAGRRKGQ